MYPVLKKKDLSDITNCCASVVILTLLSISFSCSCSTPAPAPVTQHKAPPVPQFSDSDPRSLAYVPKAFPKGFQREARKLWSLKLSGYVSELNLSHDGTALLAATLPNPDRPGGAKDARIHYFKVDSSKKHQLWDRVMKTQVKAQSISGDGKLVAVVTHDDKMLALNARGKELWETEAACSPTILRTRREIICYHDDDGEPAFAFDVYNWEGAKITSFPIKDDILTMKVSSDENWIILALTNGQVVVLDSHYKQVLDYKFGTEIVDVDVGAGADPQIAVLRLGSPQTIELIQNRLSAPQELHPPGQVGQIGFLDDSLYAYGNGEKGQLLTRLTPVASAWQKSYAKNSHYTSSLLLSRDQLLTAFEEEPGGVRQSKILAFSPSAELQWQIEIGHTLQAEEDAYLYLKSWAPPKSGPKVGKEGGRLAAAMDDGSLGVFEIR
jgi:hypothetical protein